VEATADWLRDSGLQQSDFDIMGPALGRAWRVEFTGADGLGTRRARKASQALRRADGSWLDLHARGPTGDVRLYIAEDKSMRQVRVEQAGKKLLGAIKQVHPGMPSMLLRREGAVAIAWKPICKVDFTGAEAPATILWNNTAAAAAGIDRTQVIQAFEAATGSTASIQWSV
jgi:hypothetical protein